MDEQTRQALTVVRDNQQAILWAMLESQGFIIGSDFPKIIGQHIKELSNLLIPPEDTQEDQFRHSLALIQDALRGIMRVLDSSFADQDVMKISILADLDALRLQLKQPSAPSRDQHDVVELERALDSLDNALQYATNKVQILKINEAYQIIKRMLGV